MAIGDRVLDLAAMSAAGLVEDRHYFASGSLNAFMVAGRPAWQANRERVTELLTDASYRAQVEPHLIPVADVELLRPFEVADYVDFYSSEHHATNAGRMFRPQGDPLTPNWKRLPVGYHGRAGTVYPSGTPIIRPSGQRRAPGDQEPSYGPSLRLDFEVEVGFVVRPLLGRTRRPHERVPRPRVRVRPGERLERARPASLGVAAARPVPGQVVRDVDLLMGGAGRRSG